MTLSKITMKLAQQAQYGQEMCQQYDRKFHSEGYFTKKKLNPFDTCAQPSRYVAVILCTKVNYESLKLN